MDTSETYIKMCEMAEEIQKQKTPKSVKSGVNILAEDKRTYIWLPRQDQLQEMCWELTGTKWTLFFALTMVRDFANNLQLGEGNYETMEQLWLAFAMKEKYNKTWNGKEWG